MSGWGSICHRTAALPVAWRHRMAKLVRHSSQYGIVVACLSVILGTRQTPEIPGGE